MVVERACGAMVTDFDVKKLRMKMPMFGVTKLEKKLKHLRSLMKEGCAVLLSPLMGSLQTTEK